MPWINLSQEDIDKIRRVIRIVDAGQLPQAGITKAMGRDVFFFELTATLSAGGSADAKRIELAEGVISYPQTGITVYDDLFENLTGADGDVGTYVWRGGRRVITSLVCG